MSVSKIAGFAVATLLVVRPGAFAQTTDPATTAPPPAAAVPQAQVKGADPAPQTFTGCLMTEPAYRKAHNLGEGALGGVGLGDEFVLVDAKVSPAPAMAAEPKAESKAVAEAATPSTTPCADTGTAYRLHGSLEDKMKGLVGHQIEVIGRFKHADDLAADGTRPGAKLPAEVDIDSYREVPAPAPAAVTPAAPAPPPPAPPAAPPAAVAPQPTPAPAPMPATPERHELPHTASSMMLVGFVGVLALSAGLALSVLRHRAL